MKIQINSQEALEHRKPQMQNNEPDIDTLTLDVVCKDLVFQLQTPSDIDWDYFCAVAELARSKVNKENKNITRELQENDKST